MIKIAEFGAGLKQDSVTLPIEPIGQDHLANGAHGNSVELHDGLNAITDPQVDLICEGYG
jgi:hypothetical protein